MQQKIPPFPQFNWVHFTGRGTLAGSSGLSSGGLGDSSEWLVRSKGTRSSLDPFSAAWARTTLEPHARVHPH